MKRREFISLLLGGATAARSLTARAQQGQKIARIGVLAPGPAEGPDASRVTLNSLIAGLRELGYTEGDNIGFERKFGEYSQIGSVKSLLNWLSIRLMSLSP